MFVSGGRQTCRARKAKRFKDEQVIDCLVVVDRSVERGKEECLHLSVDVLHDCLVCLWKSSGALPATSLGSAASWCREVYCRILRVCVTYLSGETVREVSYFRIFVFLCFRIFCSEGNRDGRGGRYSPIQGRFTSKNDHYH